MLKRFIFSIILLILLFGALFLGGVLPIEEIPPNPINRPPYYVIVDEVDAKYLMYTEVTVRVGDELITGDNRLYRVVEVKGNRAKARFIREEILEDV